MGNFSKDLDLGLVAGDYSPLSEYRKFSITLRRRSILENEGGSREMYVKRLIVIKYSQPVMIFVSDSGADLRLAAWGI